MMGGTASFRRSTPLLTGVFRQTKPLMMAAQTGGGALRQSKPLQAKAVYHVLWGSTANWTQRSTWGWFQVWRRLSWWAIPAGPAVMWFCFPWFSDEWKKVVTLGIYEPNLCHWDVNMTDFRSNFVKYDAKYAGIPYK